MTEADHARRRAILLLICIIVLLMSIGFRRPGDFESFYIAGGQLLKRLNPYDPMLYKSYGSFGMSSLPPAIVLTCLPCLLPLYTAIPIWDIFCLLLWSATLYLWAELLWGEAVDFPLFARLCAVSLMAPLCWAFGTHQVIVPVLFFATWACWSMRRDKSRWAGFATGLMLMKPHLTILLAVVLFIKSKRKTLFLSALAAGLILPYVPFMNTVRPITDLRAWHQTIERQQSEVFYLDEQGMAGRVASFFPLVSHADAKASSGPGILIPQSKGHLLSCFKTAFWIIGCGLWALWCKSNYKRLNDLSLYAWSLAWGLLISPYSHFYDGAILTPLIILSIPNTSQFRQKSDPLLVPFSFNFIVILLVVLANRYSFYMWPLMGWTSFAYCTFAAWMVFC
jgi:hypothetical protein